MSTFAFRFDRVYFPTQLEIRGKSGQKRESFMLRPVQAAFLLVVAACAANVAAASRPACLTAPEHTLPLPSTVAPDQFVSFEMQVLNFLEADEYGQLGWCADKDIRDTGPFQKGVSYGTHPAVEVYYSLKFMRWLANGREGPTPDGAMIIKAQFAPPAARYSSSSPAPQDWTVMIKDSAGSKDGWFWGEWYVGRDVAEAPTT